MKIPSYHPRAPIPASKNEAGGARKTEASGARSAESAGAGAGSQSSVKLSLRSEEASHVVDLARGASDFRLDVVEQARADLADGTFEFDPIAIAEGILAEVG